MSDDKEEGPVPQFFSSKHEVITLDTGMPYYTIKRMDREQRDAANCLTERIKKSSEKFKERPSQIENTVRSFDTVQMIDKNESVDFYEGCRSTLSTIMALFYTINRGIETVSGTPSGTICAATDTLGGLLIRVHQLTQEKEREVFGGERLEQEQPKDRAAQAAKFSGLIEDELARLQAKRNHKG